MRPSASAHGVTHGPFTCTEISAASLPNLKPSTRSSSLVHLPATLLDSASNRSFNANNQLANHMAAGQRIQARRGDGDQVQMESDGDWCDLEPGEQWLPGCWSERCADCCWYHWVSHRSVLQRTAPKKRENGRVSRGRVEGKGHVDVGGQRSHGADWWETTERQRQVK